MSRSRASAKAAGSRFERVVADHLAAVLDDRIDRKVKTGARDTGDIGGIRVHGHRVVAELKDYGGQLKVSEWLKEAETERINDGALAGVVIAKRRGVTDPDEQIVLMTVRDLVALISGERRETQEGAA